MLFAHLKHILKPSVYEVQRAQAIAENEPIIHLHAEFLRFLRLSSIFRRRAILHWCRSMVGWIAEQEL